MVLYIVDIISSFLYSWYFINRFSFVYSWYFINRFVFFRITVNSLVFTCSKWTMKTIKKLWYLFKINNINIKNINININFIVTLFKCFYYWLWAGFRSWSSVSVINFGQVNTCWDVYINDDTNEMKYCVSLLKTYEAMNEKQFGILNCPNFARQAKLGWVFKKLGNFIIFEIFAGNNFFSINFTLLMPFQDQKCNLNNFESWRYWTVPAILSHLGDMWKFCLSNHIQGNLQATYVGG